jgi:hypothetical protein
LAVLLLAVLLLAVPLYAGDGYWQQFVHYKMEVKLDPSTHTLTGTSLILYRNNSPSTLDKIYMYLYPNGFRNNESIRAKEAAKFFVKNLARKEAAGWIDINQFRWLPDDAEAKPVSAFKIDDSIFEAALPKPLKPGEEIRFELTFTSKVREFQDRAGYRGTQYDFAQWYPKMCVYDEEGWHAEPMHFLGEFYGEFGTFDMTIDVPFEYIVGATGVVTEGDPGWSAVEVDTLLNDSDWQKKYAEMKKAIAEQAKSAPRRRVSFHAEDVHDFAWLTSPDFLYEKGAYDGIPIHVLYRHHAKQKWSKVVTERGRRALEWLSTKFGRYPYPQLSITHGLLGGGMEYPMLVMNASENEGLILHEVGHIYFFGIFGNNEQKEAWLDEGFTSFQTRWYMETRYGEMGYDHATAMKNANWLQRHRPQMTSNQGNRNFAQFYMNSGFNEPITRYAYKYSDGLGYGVNAYTKGSIFFEMLRYVLGEETFGKICKEYFNRWALKHVNEARFRQVCEEVGGADLGWFFKQWLHDTTTVDYSLGRISKQKTGNGEWRTAVEVSRNDRGVMPVEVELSLPDGEKEIKRWDGMAEKGEVVFTTVLEPRHVALDPRDQIMDKSRIGHGTMRVEFYPDYPRMNYEPPDAYVVTLRPGGWYNDVDGARLGLLARGTYRASRTLQLGAWFGSRSSALDGFFQFNNRLGVLGTRTTYTLSAMKVEGRITGEALLSFNWSRSLTSQVQSNMQIGVNYAKLDDRGYVFRKFDVDGETVSLKEWSEGAVSSVFINYSVTPRGMSWRSAINWSARYAGEFLGGDSTFTKIDGSVRLWRPSPKLGLYLRGYAGSFIGDEKQITLQDAFSAFGATAREHFQSSYLRSVGSFPAEAHYHLPGGGNLRGYFDRPAPLRQLVAANIELRRDQQLPLLGRLLRPLLGKSTISAFFDAGRVTDLTEASNNLADAGVGITFEKQVADKWYSFVLGADYTIRIDFPIWVSDPIVKSDGKADDEVKFRYVLSFQSSF